MLNVVSHYTALLSVLKFPELFSIHMMDTAHGTEECNLFTDLVL